MPFRSSLELIEQFDGQRNLIDDIARSKDENRPAWDDVAWDAPIRPRRNVFCVGKNYAAHAEEFQKSGFDAADTVAVPDAPIVFTKTPESIIAAGDDILVPRGLTQQVDYEAEIAVIIAAPGRFIPKARAMEHVLGYTLLNDVTARDLQRHHKQWFLGKSIETFCPIGPWIVARDALALDSVILGCRVNGAVRQRAAANGMIFDVPSLIETLSKSVELKPGDVIATGTPAGVGIGMSPPRFLENGDVVTVTGTDLGTLENRVRVVA